MVMLFIFPLLDPLGVLVKAIDMIVIEGCVGVYEGRAPVLRGIALEKGNFSLGIWVELTIIHLKFKLISYSRML